MKLIKLDNVRVRVTQCSLPAVQGRAYLDRAAGPPGPCRALVFSRLSRTHEGDVSRSRHYLTLNIKNSSQMAKNTAIVAIECE